MLLLLPCACLLLLAMLWTLLLQPVCHVWSAGGQQKHAWFLQYLSIILQSCREAIY